MEDVVSAPQLRSLTGVAKGMEEIAAEQEKRLTAVCNSVFDYEKQRIFLGDPSEAEVKQFTAILKELRSLAEAIGVDWLVDRLSLSIRVFENPMTEAEADAFLAKHFPE